MQTMLEILGGGAPANNAPERLLKKNFGFTLKLFELKRRILPCHPEGGTRRIYKNSAKEILHFAHNDKKCAFTMAEVLITLGIIGIVAAMTMPILIGKYKKQEVVTKLKKVYSVMNQAIMKAEVENGPIEDWILDCGSSASPTCTEDDILDWYNLYLKKHINSLAVKKANAPMDGVIIYFPDGSLLKIPKRFCDMYFYLNERAFYDTGYRRAGQNSFLFMLNPKVLSHQTNEAFKYALGKKFEPYAWNWDGTREGLLEGKNASASYGCNKQAASKYYCAKLIQYDGWEIKDDYPW